MKYIVDRAKTDVNKCLVLVGGDGDTAEKFEGLTERLQESLAEYNVCRLTFSTNNVSLNNSFVTQEKELKSICRQLIEKHGMEKLNLFATSMGAYSTTILLLEEEFEKYIDTVILFDPADYYMSGKTINGKNHCWSGTIEYEPDEEVLSDKLREIENSVRVHVVHLNLRNRDRQGYIESEYGKRGIDYPEGYARLNPKMVRAFYSKLPDENKGRFLEIGGVPHGLFRDGDVERNERNVNKVITRLLKEEK